MAERSYWLHTLGCPKNQVDSDKLAGRLAHDGLVPATRPGEADLVVVNTCAFIEAARQESVDAVLALADARRQGRASWSPAAWPSATATSWPPPCPRWTWWPGSATSLAPPGGGPVPVTRDRPDRRVRRARPPAAGPSTSSSCPGRPPAPPGHT